MYFILKCNYSGRVTNFNLSTDAGSLWLSGFVHPTAEYAAPVWHSGIKVEVIAVLKYCWRTYQSTIGSWIASCECKKSRICIFVILQEKAFYVQISFVIYCFLHHILLIKIRLLWIQAWNKFWIVCFNLYFGNQQKNKICPKCRYDLLALTWRFEY